MAKADINYEGPYKKIPEKLKHSNKIKSNYSGKSKIVNSLEEAIEKSGLKNGDTISFHHHFRDGDYILNNVVEAINSLGIKNIKIASSSLSDIHDQLIS
ncbi:MAG: citrate lyase subunit alpha, partial [Acidaminobacteraceae bacterium]